MNSSRSYEVEQLGEEMVMVSPASKRSLAEVDAVVFDCDGVLVDVRKSYDAAIAMTAAKMTEGFSGATLPLERVGGELVLRIRRTGGFNNDWETTYAITVFSVLSLGRRNRGTALASRETKNALRKLENLVRDFASQDRLKGRASVDEYLKRTGLESDLTAELREYIDYSVDPVHTRMTRIFDEMYYGNGLFRRIFGSKPTDWSGKGLIDRERLLMTREDLKRLKKVLGPSRIALATGRPFVGVKYSLKGLLRYFNEDASVFIGDGDINPELAPQLREFKKPSGASLVRAQDKLSSEKLLYVGDSAEDRLMVKDAKGICDRVLFAGVYGASPNEAEQLEYFAQTRSDLIVKTVRTVPLMLERMRA